MAKQEKITMDMAALDQAQRTKENNFFAALAHRVTALLAALWARVTGGKGGSASGATA